MTFFSLEAPPGPLQKAMILLIFDEVTYFHILPLILLVFLGSFRWTDPLLQGKGMFSYVADNIGNFLLCVFHYLPRIELFEVSCRCRHLIATGIFISCVEILSSRQWARPTPTNHFPSFRTKSKNPKHRFRDSQDDSP